MLAVRLAEEYGKAPGPILMRDATIGEQRLQAHFFVVPASTFETSLGVTTAGLPIRFLRRPPIRAWEASTEYLPRQKRIKDQNIYEVVTGGTSGTTGPSGSGSTITDGTVVWCWRGVTE
jgi:vacuolar-type H+-ATPase catalytic subunit A/Vma1